MPRAILSRQSTLLQRLALAAAAALLPAIPAIPETPQCSKDAMLVFDGSGSMSEMGYNRLDEPRIFEARRAVRQAIPPIAEVRRIGLIVYGPGPGDSCANVNLRFAPEPDAGARIVSEVETLQPNGDTPLTDAVKQAAEVLDYRANSGVVVLVTDGKETCGGSPCMLAASLAAEAADLTVHVIGFRVRGEHFSWGSRDEAEYLNSESVARCLADRTGGQYIAAEGVDELVAALRVTLGCPIFGRGPAVPLTLPARS